MGNVKKFKKKRLVGVAFEFEVYFEVEFEVKFYVKFAIKSG